MLLSWIKPTKSTFRQIDHQVGTYFKQSSILKSNLNLIAKFSSSPLSLVKTKAQKREIARQKSKSFNAIKENKRNLDLKSKPDPILGYSTQIPNGYLSWENCELNKLILKNEDVWSGKITTDPSSPQSPPKILNFGLNEEDKQILFEALPIVSSQQTVLDVTTFESAQEERQQISLSEQEVKKKALERILDLRNANAKGIDKVNKLRILQAFSPPSKHDKPQKLDPGCSEVQAAIATYKIHTLLKHAWANTRDTDSRVHLTTLVMHRMKILKYLRRTAPERYHKLLPRIGLEPRYLRDELIVRAKLPPQPGEQLH
ncbi:hypothetical protein O181_097651 [Austropuccinia psidii MF-1]|uniref:Ribosomal protein S15 n=1 Tax=Austropuccinia psidii MF-1 TaxID=1389203 RepID=A0A9Q3J9C9_9BASI|nr:hypothetical protein [Austropuccinia psidii MF-1]